MHRYFFTTKDAFINSGSNELTGEDFQRQEHYKMRFLS